MQMYAQMRYAFQVLDALLSQLLMEPLVRMAIRVLQEINALQVYVNLVQAKRVLLTQTCAQMKFAFQVLDVYLSQLLMELLVVMAIHARQEINALQVYVNLAQA
jgi:hypothetical protein